MSLKRFILVSLLSVCLGCCSASSVFASLATSDNASSEVLDESDFVDVLGYVPMLTRSTLLGANGTISPVANSVNRNLIVGTCRSGEGGDTTISGSRKYLSDSGSYSFISSSNNIKKLIFDIPKGAIPQPGKYMFGYSFNSDFAIELYSVQLWMYKKASNAHQGQQMITTLNPNHKNNAGEFKLDPTLVDFKDVSAMQIAVVFVEPQNSCGGTLSIYYQVSNSTGTATDMGFEQTDANSAYITAQNSEQIAQNTAQLANAQNETNSKLDQIVQHISDQLFALWNQLAAYLITPWMKQDRDLHQETIDKMDDLDTNVTTTIEQKTEWHANFIIDGLKSLFIPSDEYFQTKISEMQTFFEDKLGFLGYTLTYFIRLLNGIMNASQNSVIRFPGIHAPNRATGEDYVLLPAQDVDLGAQISQISEGNFNLLEFCRTAGDIVLVLSFLVLLQDKLREVEQ